MTTRRTIPILLLLLALMGTAVPAQAQNIAGSYDVQVRGTTVYTDRSPVQESISDETTMEITQDGDRITIEFGSFAGAMSRTRFEGTVGNDRFTAIWWTSSREDEANVIWGRVSNGQLRGRLLYPRAADRDGLVPGWTEVRFSARKQEPTASVDEDCIRFDGSNLEVRRDDDGYLLTDGRSRMMMFDNRSEALRAKQTLDAYDLNQQCFVGRPDPAMRYFLSNGSAPSGAREDEDCISFNPARLTLKREGSRYLIQSNRSRMKMVDSKSEGEKIIAVIKKHGFTNTCYIGRPDPSMTYYRK
jgi:hypothetical protein